MIDKQIEKLILAEDKRQKSVINLIASENIVSKDVLDALGSTLQNKYAEGYPGRRYYGGNEIIDQIENLCIERALKLFGLKEKDWQCKCTRSFRVSCKLCNLFCTDSSRIW